MALCEIRWKSAVLMKQVGTTVILPDVGQPPFPTYYLLHGLSDDHTAWARRTRIEWYVRDLPLIVVMPDGFRGFYTDNEAGPAYGRYIAEEVVGFIERNFPARREASARHIGGLSMGGYGAVRLALKYPHLFSSANSHSGAFLRGPVTPVREVPDRFSNFSEEMLQIFGPHPVGTEHDVLALVQRAKAGGTLPRLYFDCGTEDYLLQPNRDLHQALLAMDVPHVYREFPGAHDWDYWDRHVAEAIAFHLNAT
jgi:S-formylglutathione hydrolase FrmB